MTGGRPLGKRLFTFFTLFVAAPTLVLVTLSDVVMGTIIHEEVGKEAAAKLRVAHSIETLLDDLVQNTSMRITLDPSLPLHGPAKLEELNTGDLQYAYRRALERVDDSVRTNALLDSIEIVLEGNDYLLSSRSGVVSWSAYTDRAWLEAVVRDRGFTGSGSFLPPHSAPEGGALVLSYYFPFPPYLTDRHGAVVIHILEGEFSRLINSPAHGGDGAISLVDAEGRVVSDRERARVGKEWEPGRRFPEGEGLFVTASGEHLITWFRPERGVWTYVGDHPLQGVLSRLDALRWGSVFVSLALVALGAAVSYAVSKRFLKPVSAALDGLKVREDEEALLHRLRGEDADCPLPQGLLAAALAVPDGGRTDLLPELRRRLDSAFRGFEVRTAVCAEGVALVLTAPEEGGAFADRVEETWESIELSEGHATATLCVGSRGNASELAASWREAVALLKQRFVQGPGQWYWAENPEVPAEPFYPAAVERLLLTAVESSDLAAMHAAVAGLEAALSRRQGLSADHAELILHQIAGGVIKHLLATRKLAQVLGVDSELQHSLQAETVSEALQAFRAVLDRLLEGQTSTPGYVEAMLAFIREHFRRDFGVDEVAAAAGLSYSHARKVFEDAVGESIVEHVNALRLEEARRLLRETGSSVEVVARSVGYNNGLGLHRHFKKTLGKTPGEYRSTLRQKR